MFTLLFVCYSNLLVQYICVQSYTCVCYSNVLVEYILGTDLIFCEFVSVLFLCV